jgi:hypothetical protein
MDGPLTPKQKTLLEQFRVKVADVLKPEDDDEYLLRWIRAREWDLKKAEKMLRDSLQWRKKYGTDKLLEWKIPEVLTKYSPGNYFGHDKKGFPIWYELLGRYDMKGLMLSATKKDIVKYRIAMIEHLLANIFPKCSKEAGKRIDKCDFIVDMDGVGLKHLWKPAVDVMHELLSVVEANYPERLQICYVINAPSILPIFYNMIKPFLAEYTRTKIRILGSNWKQDLLKDIDADQLPVHWGGTRTDPDGDPFCKSQICIGGPVPESYRLKNAAEANIDMSQFTTVTIARGQSLQLDFQVVKKGSLLRWNFWTTDNDLGFGIYRRKDDSKQKVEEMEEVVSPSRVNCHIVPEADSIVCDVVGTYVVRFDNTYSWVNAKKVSYFIEVLLPARSSEVRESTQF